MKFLYFYGPNMTAVYDKYLEEGGIPCFCTENPKEYTQIFMQIHKRASIQSTTADMYIYGELTFLLTLFMKDCEKTEKRVCRVSQKQDMQKVKDYLDQNYCEKRMKIPRLCAGIHGREERLRGEKSGRRKMYERAKSRWFKHFDFMLLDMVVIELTYLLVCYLRMKNNWYLFSHLYRNVQIYVVLFDFIIVCAIPVHKNILKRKVYQELWESVKNISVLVIGVILFLYFGQQSYYFSRSIFTLFWVFASVSVWLERSLYKVFVRKKLLKKGNLPRMLLVTDSERMKDTIAKMKRHSENRFTLSPIVLTDYQKHMAKAYGELLADMENNREAADEFQMIGDCEDMFEYLKDHVIDEIMLDVADTTLAEDLTQELMITGVTVHINLVRAFGELPNQIVERVGGLTVMTSSIHLASPIQLMLKRVMDIAGSLVGLLITGIAFIIFAPIIYIQSPGPIFYSQLRVGKSGRKFKIYKFRSMYPDADKRKAELIKQNKMEGLMFKMDNDPRIIPIGHIMRKLSIDELPQFYNILKGDMSLVGTRPPTVDEWEQYSPHHRARLCAKPGLTGMWQVSGRSDITNFEEVVALDLKYIREWSIFLDIKLILKTVQVVVTGKGSV